jgi:hypothetical protein
MSRSRLPFRAGFLSFLSFLALRSVGDVFMIYAFLELAGGDDPGVVVQKCSYGCRELVTRTSQPKPPGVMDLLVSFESEVRKEDTAK